MKTFPKDPPRPMHPLLVAMEELQTKPCSGFLTGRGPSAHVPALDLHEWVYSSPQTSAVDAVINPTAQKEDPTANQVAAGGHRDKPH